MKHCYLHYNINLGIIDMQSHGQIHNVKNIGRINDKQLVEKCFPIIKTDFESYYQKFSLLPIP